MYSDNYINDRYSQLCNKPSDINEHLPTLYRYAKECESIFETGVRGVVSSWALVKGLLDNEKPNKYILLNDITKCNIGELINATQKLPITIEYKWMNNLHLDLSNNVDLTFIDTWHIYGQLKRELAKFSKVTNKYIIMHDTTVDEIVGETIRNGWNPIQNSKDSGFPVEEIVCGLKRAIDEFLSANPEWILHEKYVNNNGLTVLKRSV
jgi:hypothetical protein